MESRTPAAPPAPRGLRSFLRWWLQPRATNREEAFRERVMRSALLLIIFLGFLSFLSTLFVFRSEWSVISFPTLHIVALTICFLSVGLLLRGKLLAAGWMLVFAPLFGASGIILLSRQTGAVSGLFLGFAAFTFAPLIATMVLPRYMIIPVSLMAAIMYGLSQFGLLPDTDFSLPGLRADQQIISVLILLLVEGFLLRQLGTEFDARLEAMRQSMRETELAKQRAEADRQRAEAADQAKSQFLANMSHELRTPLNAIIGYDEAMLAGMVGTFTPKQTELLGHIQKNSRRLLALINDVLDLSKIESGTLEVYLAPMSPRKIIYETVESLQSLATSKNVALMVKIADQLPEVILGDAKKVEQVLVNLVGNAVKFTEEGSVKVAAVVEDDRCWQFSVEDTGIGISAEALPLIFEPFRQVDGSASRKYKGTGLGLSISKQLVEKLGGHITVQSSVGKGSTFTVVLPIIKTI